MAIHFFVNLDCVPRETFGEEGLWEAVRLRATAAKIREQFEQRYGEDAPPPEKMRMRRLLTNAEGQQDQEEPSVADLEEETKLLIPLSKHCRQCPANVTGEHYGCFGQITLPITQAAERWLAGRVPTPGTRFGDMLVAMADAYGYGRAEELANWRKAGFIRAQHPLPLEGFDAHSHLTTDTLLHAMLLVGDLAPEHCLALLLWTQSIGTRDGGGGEEVLAMIGRVGEGADVEDEPGLAFLLEPEEGEEESTAELKLFLAAAYHAFGLSLPLAVRM